MSNAETEQERKEQAYRDGDYAFEARYLEGNLDLWTDADWVRFIEKYGYFTY